MNSRKASLTHKTDEEVIHMIHSLNPDVRALIERYINRLLQSDKYQK